MKEAWILIHSWSGLTEVVEIFDTEQKALDYAIEMSGIVFECVYDLNEHDWGDTGKEYQIWNREVR